MAKGGPAGASKSPGSGPPPRQRKYLPILFDFEKPKSRNTDETITLLARMARFVVADKGGAPGGVGAGALTDAAPDRGRTASAFVRKSGREMLSLSLSAHDPSRPSAALDFCNAHWSLT